jgi:hypothetical protein
VSKVFGTSQPTIAIRERDRMDSSAASTRDPDGPKMPFRNAAAERRLDELLVASDGYRQQAARKVTQQARTL